MKTSNRSNVLAFLSLIVASILVTVSVIKVFLLNRNSIENYVLNDDTKIALALLIIIYILIFFKKRVWNIVFLIALLFSYTDYVAFFSSQYSFGIGSLSIQLIPTGLLFLHVAFNYDYIKKFLS